VAGYQLRICQNKTCKSQGSPEILKFVQDLSLPEVEAEGCGCLGNCGNGPNMVILPDETVLSHVGTVAKMTNVLNTHCKITIDPKFVIATQLRIAGNSAARSGDLSFAEEKYTEAIEMDVDGSLHLLFSNRSGVRARMDDLRGALSDALLAIQHSPSSYTTSYLRLIDVYYLHKDYRGAAEVLDELTQRNPEFKNSSEYKVILKQLRTDLKAR